MSFVTLLRWTLNVGKHRSPSLLCNQGRLLCSKSPHSEKESGGSSSTSNSSSSEDESTFNENKQESNLEDKILRASLSYVNIHGWSSDAISKGAESLGYSHMIQGMFPGGGTDLINFFYLQCNNTLEEELKRKREAKKEQGMTSFIKEAVEFRLRMNIPYMENWAQAAALHASPSNCTQGMNNICTLVDHIWYHAGDKSTDFSWYTKRTTLAVVYKSTELCMIQDDSDDYKETWSFLGRRLDDLKTVANCFREAEARRKDIESIGKAGILTGLNILGLNIKSR